MHTRKPDPQGLLPALLEKPAHLGEIIDHNKHSLGNRVPREDYLKTILFFRKEGLLTNKLNDLDLANLLEILTAPMFVRYQLLAKDTGGFTMEMEELSDDASKKWAEELSKEESEK